MILLSLLLQTTPVAPIVKGTALPPPGSEEAAVTAPLVALLAALERSDGAAILAQTLPDGIVTAVRTGADGQPQRRSLRWAEFAAQLKPDGARIVERIGRPAVEIDGEVAMIWTPYTVTVDGTLSHCGYDHVDAVRTATGWKILNLTYSHRTQGCAQP
ncbi:hypothetical protein [Sphingomonas corticis]|jgi:hypothetical protein|uniref:Nuclear transport factor 2 family protein n=1 Tax=Sphingomonas corticis TaxID=2722791 RepID=A0ABX1CRA9_9SPHN|nr:hypothetical protein [Sphingomonas corticis]NJR79816.1 hypothetical protein [Sphingomonas corticis]